MWVLLARKEIEHDDPVAVGAIEQALPLRHVPGVSHRRFDGHLSPRVDRRIVAKAAQAPVGEVQELGRLGRDLHEVVPGYAIFSGNPARELLVVGRAVEVHDHHFIPRTQVFTRQLNGLEPGELELAVLEERTFRRGLPGCALAILDEHGGRLGGQHDGADAVSREQQDQQTEG